MNAVFTPSAERDLKNLQQSIAERMMKKILWHAKHYVEEIPQPLNGRFKGFYKWRIGDWRVLYSINEKDNLIVVEMIGHRREIYRS